MPNRASSSRSTSKEEAHRPIEQALVQPEVIAIVHAEEQQAVGAVGGEGERELLPDQPAGKVTGGRENKACIPKATYGRGRGAGDGLAR